MCGDVYNTTVNINGDRVYSRTFFPGMCCGRMYPMNSCFGFGYACVGNGISFGIGCALGRALVPALPSIASGAWSGVKWIGNTVAKGAKAVAKGVSNLWNSIFHKKSKTKDV